MQIHVTSSDKTIPTLMKTEQTRNHGQQRKDNDREMSEVRTLCVVVVLRSRKKDGFSFTIYFCFTSFCKSKRVLT